jgi:hypothetical protein
MTKDLTVSLRRKELKSAISQRVFATIIIHMKKK